MSVLKRINGSIIAQDESKTIRQLAVQNKHNLKEADLRKADLEEANLWKADLRKAFLRKANLWKADLRKADLREADLNDTVLCDANLDGAKVSYRGGVVRIRFSEIKEG